MKNWGVVLILFVGTLVFTMSLYMASLSGVMGKLGLVGGDFSQAINNNELARQLITRNEDAECGLWQTAKHIPGYFMAESSDKIKLSGELGGERIICGVRLVQQHNTERGVYTIVKGLYYLKSQYTEMRLVVERDRAQCKLLTDPDYEQWVEGYLMATEGRVHEVVLDVYKQIESERSRVEELCTD